MSPSELVRHAKDAGLAAIALTDHDTIAGIPEAVEEGRRVGMEVVPGIEISADYKNEMHILGYFKEEDYLRMTPVLSYLRESRENRNKKIIDKLNEMGFDITMEEVSSIAKGKVVGRPHIAKIMMEKGYVRSVSEAFEKYLEFGKPAYFKKEKLTPQQGIETILKAGGIPVLAHPVLLKIPFEELDALLKELVSYGLKGIEAYYVYNSEDFTITSLELARKYNLVPTGGSDFHGTFKPGINIGTGYGNLRVDYGILIRIKELLYS